jgi:hypothetical protein
MRKIVQIIPAQPGTIVRFVLTDGQAVTKPVVCWALSEWYDSDGMTSEVVPMVLDYPNDIVAAWDVNIPDLATSVIELPQVEHL